MSLSLILEASEIVMKSGYSSQENHAEDILFYPTDEAEAIIQLSRERTEGKKKEKRKYQSWASENSSKSEHEYLSYLAMNGATGKKLKTVGKALGLSASDSSEEHSNGKTITEETARNYRTYLNRFSRWRTDSGQEDSWPPSREEVAKYRDFLSLSTKMTPATQRNYVGAINFKIKNPTFK